MGSKYDIKTNFNYDSYSIYDFQQLIISFLNHMLPYSKGDIIKMCQTFSTITNESGKYFNVSINMNISIDTIMQNIIDYSINNQIINHINEPESYYIL